MSVKFYFINLDCSPERRQFMENQFSEFSINVIRIPAVDGNQLKEEFIRRVTDSQSLLAHFMLPKLGEIGAFLSHKLSWEIISQQSEEFAVVLEDDLLINDDLFTDLNEILKMVTINDIVDISGRKGFIEKAKKFGQKDVKLTRYSTPPLGMTGKIIGKNAATNLSAFFPDYMAPVDVMVQKIYQHKIPIWSVNKQYLSHIDQQVGGTTIQAIDITPLRKIAREFKRIFWRLAIKIGNFIFDYRRSN
jgi:glycosyl transferase family 25